MIMPDMDGRDTYQKLKEINPEIKVILSSGYSKNGRVEEVMNKGVIGFVQKPYRMNDLSKAISQAIKT